MRYVSELQSDVFGQVPELIYLLNSVDRIGSAVVRDTESDYVETLDIRQLDSWETLGVGTVMMACEGIVACHSKKTALLHHHIESVRSEHGVPIGHVDGSYDVRKRFLRGYKTVGASEFIINTGDLVYEILGCLGSVCVRPGSVHNRSKACTLYELLGVLCHESGVNLLSYRTLRICNDLRRVTTTIKFYDCIETDRYLTKMYMDVVKSV